MTKLRNGGRILVDNLVAQGCDRIFHVPGESFLAVLDALHDVPEIDLVTCRQEGGAAFMACADGTMTGKPGVCFVTRGPGATNASIGVHVAMQDSQPMLLFIGDVDRSMRDREGFQEVDFPAMFAPLAKWATRIEDARRIPEYVARAWNVATSGRPGPVVIALPEDMLLDEVEAVDRPVSTPYPLMPDVNEEAAHQIVERIRTAKRPLAIVGGAGWDISTGRDFATFAERWGIPVAGAFRRQDAIRNTSPAWAGNLGYGPNPKLTQRIRDADLLLVVGARLGEATTDGYTLVTPDHPGQTLIHVHPDPEELNRVYHADMAVCCDVGIFAEMLTGLKPLDKPFAGAAEAHAEWLDWSTPKPREGVTLDLGQCVAAMRERLGPDDAIICNGAGNFSGWWHRYWHYGAQPTQLAPTSGAMGYGTPAAVAAALRRSDRLAVALAGDGDFMMNGQELATAIQHDVNMLVLIIDNGAYGTIRMHQEREFPARLSGTTLHNPDFAALARAYGCWAETVVKTDEFAPALDRALSQTGVRLLHLKTDVEFITPGTTITAIRG
ncbi:thiamine pyrophosphate-binding protein [Sphingomonas koreensis]|jgi:acetolactate synthase-1/2/3 large subunit|uniref:Thiamine pyrophosphate-binding protein n=14 Tax=Sphingomonas koreensis TaxID=93064 RepID=A0A1L6JC65_9SPHN|nr:thiamine pyrophosphate-binding protein [Sphingomonas koreensis]APR53529.1 thiamine pyrophosphate-binding protein [Sphingomonas koreensis]MDC7809757.1 thiamine pyrophosphate-binding protein [Sphingomonas koreensis]RSU21015.1 thiamine pyrophosphate-binding protein [Sphingomonas koreensis]RSU22058.1 thiamine pyrophosphate-binding protein [Sphingomonas koreensis]RSU24340.1 thiamine pyrophosphate-binding protein [Sphingomonas koreensis]